MIWILLILFTLATYILYRYSIRNYSFWKNKGIPYVNPLPFVGNFLDVLTFRSSIGVLLTKYYEIYAKQPYFGIFALNKPFLVIRCPELIKSLLIKDFNYFTDRNLVCDEEIDSITANFIPFMKNPKWRQLRAKMTPVFTIAKVKNMTGLMREVIEEMVEYVEEHLTEGAIDAKLIVNKYAVDVIATCAFGVTAHSFQKENAEVEMISKKMFNVNWKGKLIQSCYFFIPSVINLFKFPFFDTYVRDCGRKVFWDVIEERKKNNSKRNDVIDVINEIREFGLTDDDLPFDGDRVVAQPLLFLVVGFKTTGIALLFALYELCLNPDIQTKLREEVKTVLLIHKDFTYEALQELKYTEMVLYETLRKHPPIPFLDRIAVENYQMPNTNIILEKGTGILIPCLALHRDPEYFPSPEVFDPERFSDKNKEFPCYLPFGIGPRGCMGIKFAMLEMKLFLARLLIQFILEKCAETPEALQYAPDHSLTAINGNLPIRFRRIV